MEHTKEPWNIRELGDDCFITAAIEPGMAYGPEIMGDDYTGYGGEARKRADARRIVACVNACAGIPTEHVERCNAINAVDEIIKERNALTKERNDLVLEVEILVRQRDELVAALIRLDGWLKDRHLVGLMPDELALLASVKGEKEWN